MNVSIGDVNAELQDKGYVVLPPVDTALTNSARDEYFRLKKLLPLKPQSTKFGPKDVVQSSFRKTAVGSGNGLGDPVSQVVQTTYYSNHNNECRKLNECFNILIEMRNIFCGLAENYGFNFAKDGFWNATRVHHYPSGGGHMQAHCDTYFPDLLDKRINQFVQVSMSLSKRGDDFHSGGFHITNRQGERVDVEPLVEVGSVLIFDGTLKHGVQDIDHDKVLNWDSDTGRIALFANLYKYRD